MGGDVRQSAGSAYLYVNFLNQIGKNLQNSGLPSPAASEPVSKEDDSTTVAETPSADIQSIVEDNLALILSSPLTSSNPQDYIDAHQEAYESILKYGNEDALSYMLSQFESGNADGLRGHILMRLCKEILGARNNITDESLSPQEWYDSLSIRKEIVLSDFSYDGNDPVEKLVYATETEKNRSDRGFTVVAPKIFASYEEGELLKVFVTTYSQTYKLYGSELSEEGSSVIPSAITYRKDQNGNYALVSYEQAKDGSYFAPSIRAFCKMPVSGKTILGLADKILAHEGNYEDLGMLLRENLLKHLRKNSQVNVTINN